MTSTLNLVEKVYSVSQAAIKNYPCHMCRASTIGDACLRRLVYERVAWDQKAPHDVHLERIFAEGRVQEEAVLRELAAAGVSVIEQQSSGIVGKITYHVDGVIVMQGEDGPMSVPLEIKSMSPHIWGAIFVRGPGVYEWPEVAEAFGRWVWTRRYYAQLQVYSLGKNSSLAILLAKDKTSGAIAQVNVPLDWDAADMFLRRADEVEEHVKDGTMPDRIPFDDDVCTSCPFGHMCCPEQVANPLALLADDVVLDKLTTREQTREARERYEEADAKVKAWAKARPEDRILVCGQFLVEKRVTKRGTCVDITRAPAAVA